MTKALLLLGVALAAPAAARTLDLAKPDDALAVSRKMTCSTIDNQPVTFRWSGRAYSRVAGEQDRLLFGLEGMNIRTCVTVTDPVRGTGYRQVSREIMLYLDPKTGRVLRTWTNPWTDEKVDVIHVANDPVNMRSPTFPRSADGKPFKYDGEVQGGYLIAANEVPLFYENALGGRYQDYVGGKYQAMEIFDFAARAERALDSRSTQANPYVAWVRMAEWLPWMKMRGRQGQMIFNATGRMLDRFDELPEVMKKEIAANYPDYVAPPPGNDSRPNETSWTYFAKKLPTDK